MLLEYSRPPKELAMADSLKGEIIRV